jgi:hypothetical protein
MTDQRADSIESTTRMAVLVDQCRWDDLAGLFSEEVRVDDTSLVGGAPEVVSSSGLVAGWAGTLGRLAVTQHLVANHFVAPDGEHAELTAAFQATRVTAGVDQSFALGDDYRFGLDRVSDAWRISAVMMTSRWEIGDRSIVRTGTSRHRTAGDDRVAVRLIARCEAGVRRTSQADD